jgi:F-type H+-transporting ATPase subunit b
MADTLKQLGELLLSSIPTIICLLVVWGAYRFIVHSRLQQVLGERHARTEGAIQQAQSEIAAAEARTAEYEQRVREARLQIFHAQGNARRLIMEQRNRALAQARREAEAMVKSARAALQQEVAAAKAALQKQADSLADEIIQTILKPAAALGSR